MNAGVFNMLADRPQHDVPLVGDRIDLYLPSMGFEFRNYHGMFPGHAFRPPENPEQFVFFVSHTHGGAAQDIARPNEYGEASETVNDSVSLGRFGDMKPAGLVDT